MTLPTQREVVVVFYVNHDDTANKPFEVALNNVWHKYLRNPDEAYEIVSDSARAE